MEDEESLSAEDREKLIIEKNLMGTVPDWQASTTTQIWIKEQYHGRHTATKTRITHES